MRGNILIPLISLIIALALSWLFTLPRWNGVTGAGTFNAMSVAELRVEREIYKDAFGKMREIELARTGLAAKYNAVSEEDRTRLSKLVGDHPDSVRMVLDIENRARARGLKLRSVTAGAGASSQTGRDALYESIPFAFTAVGSYAAFVPFLSDLEASVRLADITGIDFEVGKDDEEYVYNISLSFYQLTGEDTEE